MRRRITHTLVFAAVAALATQAQAQQAGTTQRVTQPVYQAANGENIPAYASQYAATADGNGYDGSPVGYYDEEPQATRELGVEQVANLTYQPQQADATATDTTSSQIGSGNCCPTSCCQTSCCTPFWVHRNSVFFDFLVLKPRNADVANAVPQNGIGPTAVPFGNVGSNSPTYQPGFRVGGTMAINRCSSLYAAYTYFQAESNGSTFANPPLVVHSLVTLPQTGTAASDGPAALSRDAIRFQFADIDYRRLIAGGNNWYVNYAVGARYANLYQMFSQAQVNGPTITGVGTRIGMDALGTRVGLLAARKAANRGFYMYGSAFADILVGNFRASYVQLNNLAGVQGFNNWQNFRPVPILEYELGAGWRSPNGNWQFSGGYYFACWFNAITTSNYIQSVQNNNFVGVGNAITFDGLVLRAQRLW
ncbi:MAG TPA: Lpg1974 family pore-forming outer membrane protein [Pirellulales bacterium]|nr:Lpg1974 family pore-forming outer membrane protein [Pirellulales bacterium]